MVHTKIRTKLAWPIQSHQKNEHIYIPDTVLSKNVSVVLHVVHLNIITEDLESEHDTSCQTLDENNDYDAHREA